jgi:hypothetical protein
MYKHENLYLLISAFAAVLRKGASTNSYEDIHGDEEKQRRGGGHVKHG